MWYLMSGERYYTGLGWAPDRASRKRYSMRWLAVLIRQAVGGYIHVES